MAGFYLYTSNRVEHLIPVLGQVLCTPRRSLFESEIIVVQNKGMEQWLSLQIAELLKISAFCEFPFPNAFLDRLFKKNIPKSPDKLSFEPELLLWKIFKLLPRLTENNSFDSLKSYLRDKESLKLFQLSKKIADIFDQYTMYRPEMINSWESGSEEQWQALLWRALNPVQPSHRLHLKTMFFKKILQGQIDLTTIPQRVCFFGISSLPPFFTDLIGVLSQTIDIHYFLLNPCAEYWDDIISEKEFHKVLKKQKRTGHRITNPDSLHYETGNPLLSSLGGYGKDFIARLHELDCIENTFPVSIESHDLLRSIQSDILTLTDQMPKEITTTDNSVQVHSCHSPMREVEVLYDNILNFFDTIPGLKSSEIIVLAPDIELYASYIKTVFGAPQKNPLPYTLADRSIKDESMIAEGFLELLDILNSRFTSNSIINLLEIDEVRDNFEISIDDLSIIKIWIKKVGIRWSLDAESKKKYSIPQTAENSWKSGLDQLLLGFALPVQDVSLFNGLAGSNLVEGNSGEVLGKFLNFFTVLSTLRILSEKKYLLEEWADILLKTLDQLFSANVYKQQEVTNIVHILSALTSHQSLSEFNEPVQFDIIKAYLKLQFTGTRISHGFLNGSITFCSLLPMRGIPFRILCLLGLNEKAFPRKSHHVSWDLIAASPRKGDRSVETEDRYIFLEALLSARDVFYVSYIGQNIQKNNTQHPSVCVEELLDYIATRYSSSRCVPEAGYNDNLNNVSVREQITFNHRLHAFNLEYFRPDSKLFSYSEESLNGVKKLLEPKLQPHSFFDTPLPAPSVELYQLSIEELIRFFVNPSKYLLQKRLNIFLSSHDEEIQSIESFNIAGLEKYELSDTLFKKAFNEDYTKESLYNLYKALNLLPHGQIGEFSFQKLYSDVNEFSKKVYIYHKNNKLVTLRVDLNIDAFHLKGQLNSIQQDYMLLFRNAIAKPKDYLNAWIKHLCLNACNSDGYPKTSVFVAKDTVVKFSPAPDAHKLLHSLLNEYLNGLSQPLQFFPQCSWEYATALSIDNKSSEEAFLKSYKSWHNENRFTFAKESEDPYIKLCFSTKNPIDKTFETTAIKIINPLLTNMLQTSDKE